MRKNIYAVVLLFWSMHLLSMDAHKVDEENAMTAQLDSMSLGEPCPLRHEAGIDSVERLPVEGGSGYYANLDNGGKLICYKWNSGAIECTYWVGKHAFDVEDDHYDLLKNICNKYTKKTIYQ